MLRQRKFWMLAGAVVVGAALRADARAAPACWPAIAGGARPLQAAHDAPSEREDNSDFIYTLKGRLVGVAIVPRRPAADPIRSAPAEKSASAGPSVRTLKGNEPGLAFLPDQEAEERGAARSSLADSKTIQASQEGPGHRDNLELVAAVAGEAQPGRVTIHLPEDGRLYIDGVLCPLTGKVRSFDTPPLVPGLKYYFTLRAEAVRDGQPVVKTERLYVSAGEESRVTFNLPAEAKAEPSRVTVRLPEDGQLYVDGAPCPLTGEIRTLDTPPLPPGRKFYYTLRAEVIRNGQTVSKTQRVFVSGGKESNVTFDNLDAPPAQPGRVTVRLPQGAQLYVDGTLCPAQGEVFSFPTPPLEVGRKFFYTLKAQAVRDGQVVTDTKQVYVRAGEESRVDFGSLNAAASGPQSAKVLVRLPGDARLYVDDVYCPLTGEVRSFDTPPLEAGRKYYYTLRAEVVRGGVPRLESRRVTVLAGKVSQVEFAGTGMAVTSRREDSEP